MNTSWSLGCCGVTSVHPHHSRAAHRSTGTHSKGQRCCKRLSWLILLRNHGQGDGVTHSPPSYGTAQEKAEQHLHATRWALLRHIVPGGQRDSIRKCFILFGCTFIRPGPCLIDPMWEEQEKDTSSGSRLHLSNPSASEGAGAPQH